MGQSKKRRENLKRMQKRTWYSSRAMQGYDWARFFVFVGGRGAGKSTDIQRFLAKQWSLTGQPFTWLRLSDAEIKKLKADNGHDCWEKDGISDDPRTLSSIAGDEHKQRSFSD